MEVARDEDVEVHVGPRQVVAGGQARLEEEHRPVAVGQDDAVELDDDVAPAAQRLDALVRVARVAADLLVLLEPPVEPAGLPAEDQQVPQRRVVTDPRGVRHDAVADARSNHWETAPFGP